MRVLMVTPHFWPALTGSGSVVMELGRALSARGDDVTVLTVALTSGPDDEIVDGLKVIRMPARAINLGHLSYGYRLPFVTRPGIRRRVGAVLDDIQPDVVHMHGQFWDLCQWTGSAAKRRGIPTVMSVHTLVSNENWAYNAVASGIDRAYVGPIARRVSDVWTGCDQRSIHFIHRRYRVDDATFLPNPVDVDIYATGDGARVRQQLNLPTEPIILSLGHVIPLRNRVTLVRSLPAVLRAIPEAHLVVVGEVIDRHFLREARHLGVEDRIVCAGRVPHDEVADWLAAGTVMATGNMLGVERGLGTDVSTIEAMASETPPVVVMRPQSLPGVDLGEYPGLSLLTNEDPASLASELVRLLGDSEARETAVRASNALCRDIFARNVVHSTVVGIYRAAGGRTVASDDEPRSLPVPT